MRVLFFLSVALMMGCANRITPEQRARDDAMKDSIALADGNKVLGNINFGIGEEEFEDGVHVFMQENENSLLGQEIQNIAGTFTQSGELCRATFVSVAVKDKYNKINPFRSFVEQKFGLETIPNHRVVGGRRIILGIENRAKDFEWALGTSYLRARNNPGTDFHEPPYDPFEKFDFYVMHIQNDSLYNVYTNELAAESQELQRQSQEKKEAERQFHENQIQNL
jgi:hypothetical protein